MTFFNLFVWPFLLYQEYFSYLKPITTKCYILTHYRYIAVDNIVRKGKIAYYKQFLLFSQCYLPNKALIFHFKCTLKCCLQSVSI